jgi:SAM-dependent methyltransferase
MPYADATFDLVISDEAISHYAQPDAFLREAHRVLRVGGVIMVADGNNGANPMTRRVSEEMWDAVEVGPAGRRYKSSDGRAVVAKPHVQYRAELVRERFPQIDETTAQAIGSRTADYSTDQVIDAARQFEDTGSLPSSVYHRGDVAIRPWDGIAEERLVDPRQLVHELSRLGFKARARGHWGGANRDPLYRGVDNLPALGGSLTLPLARAFRVTGIKL